MKTKKKIASAILLLSFILTSILPQGSFAAEATAPESTAMEPATAEGESIGVAPAESGTTATLESENSAATSETAQASGASEAPSNGGTPAPEGSTNTPETGTPATGTGEAPENGASTPATGGGATAETAGGESLGASTTAPENGAGAQGAGETASVAPASVTAGTVTFVTKNGNQTVKFASLDEAINHTDVDGNKANTDDFGGGTSKAYFIGWSSVPNYRGQDGAKVFYSEEPISNAFPEGFTGDDKLYAFYLDIGVAPFLASRFNGKIEINKDTLISKEGTMDLAKIIEAKSPDKTTTFYLKNDLRNQENLNLGASFTLNPFITAVVRYSPSHYFQPGTAEHYGPIDEVVNANPDNFKEKIESIPNQYTYVDLHVKLDPRVEVADELYFKLDSYSFRPFSVLKGDYSGKFTDQTITDDEVKVALAGEKEFILRTRIEAREHPGTISLADASKDMELISLKPDNFSLSKEEILKIARDEKEAIKINGHIQGGAKLYQINVWGFTMGGPSNIPKQTAQTLVLDFEPALVTFDRNSARYDDTSPQNLGEVGVAIGGSIEGDILDGQTKPSEGGTWQDAPANAKPEAMPDDLSDFEITEGDNAGQYTFKGWATTQDASEANFDGTTVVSENMTVYAVWESKVKVKFFKNDLEEGVDPDTSEVLHEEDVVRGKKLAQFPAAPEREGYIFNGWGAKTPDGTVLWLTTNTQPTAETTYAQNTNYYATWSEAVDVTFDKNYPDAPDKLVTKKVAKDEALGQDNIPENPQRAGYTFKGWGSTANATEKIENLAATVISAPTTFFAIWERTPDIEISYGFRSGMAEIENLPADVIQALPVVPNDTVASGSTVTKDNVKSRDYFKDLVNIPSTLTDASGVVRKVVWRVDKANLATLAYKDTTNNVLVDDNYRIENVQSNIKLEIPIVPFEQVTVIFDKNDGSEDNVRILKSATFDKDGQTAPAENPTRAGYTFLGWAKGNAQATTKDETQPTAETRYSEDTTYFAVWKETPNQIKVSFDKNDGQANNIIKEETINVGSGLTTLPDTPIRIGYTFLGWAKGNANATTPDIVQPSLADTYSEDTVFYAIWKQNPPSGGGGGGSVAVVPPSVPKKDTPTSATVVPEALNSVDHMHYIVGYPDSTVRPNQNITRAEITSVYYRLLNDKKRDEIFTKESGFSDVKVSNWYNKAVSSMTKGNYIAGYPDNTFGGNKAMTRAEFVAVTARFLDKKAGAMTFTDVSDTHWARDAISAGVAYGWLTGYEDGTFRPEQAITRAEAMAIINRLLDRGVDEDGLKTVDYKKWIDNEKGKWYYYEVIEATNDHKYTGKRPSEVWSSLKIDRVYDYDKYERPDKLA